MKISKYRLDIPPNTKLSPALRRLIEEVRNERDHLELARYDRIHSRHNRSVG